MSDTIYREDAVKEIRDYMVMENEAISEHPDDILTYNSGLLTAIQAVHDLPSADRPQGEWKIRKPEEEGFGAVFRCSRCSYEVDCVPTNFCPDCGARMKGADDDD